MNSPKNIFIVYKNLKDEGGVPGDVRTLMIEWQALGLEVTEISSMSELMKSLKLYRRYLRNSKPEKPRSTEYLIVEDLSPLFFITILSSIFLKFRICILLTGLSSRTHWNSRFGGEQNSLFRRNIRILVLRVLIHPLIRKANLVRANSQRELETLGIDKDFVISPESFENSEFRIDKSRIVEKYQNKVFLFAGRMEPYQKGLDILVKAISEGLRRDLICDARFVFVGSNIEVLQKLLHEHGLVESKQIVLEEHKDHSEVIALMQNSFFFLHPSRYEGVSRAARESISTGCPVIASIESNLGQFCTSDGIGLQCELDPENVLQTILMAMQMSKDDYENMVVNCLAFSSDNSSLNAAKAIASKMRLII